jgi:5S rRNA maturation endonuclease (ribonuclease M5)
VTDITEIVMNQTGRSYFQAVRFLKSQEVETDLLDQIQGKLEQRPDYAPYPQSEIDRLNANAKASQRAVDYYQSRKISLQSINKFMLGYSEKMDMVTIPVHSPDGVPVGFVGRSVEGKDFKNTPNLPKSKVLFNLHRIKTSRNVYVVESSFDAIRLDQCGLPSVATLGSNVSKIQIDLLRKYFNDIIVIADNDMAGNNMADKLKEKLGHRVSILSLEQQYKDVGDMEDEQIKSIRFDFDKSISSMLT